MWKCSSSRNKCLEKKAFKIIEHICSKCVQYVEYILSLALIGDCLDMFHVVDIFADTPYLQKYN